MMTRTSSSGDSLNKNFLAFIFKYIRHIEKLPFDNRMVLLNREGSFNTESLPDGKLLASNHRQFRWYCPLGPSQPKRKRGGKLVSVKQESIPWQSFVVLMQYGHPRFE